MTPYSAAYHLYRVIRRFLRAALQSISVRLPPRGAPSSINAIRRSAFGHAFGNARLLWAPSNSRRKEEMMP